MGRPLRSLPFRRPAFGDLWLVAWLVLLLLTARVLIGINALFTHYTGISYLPRALLPLLPPALAMTAFGLAARESRPRAAFFARNMGFYALSMFAQAVLATGIQYTPFPSIDPLLAHWDAALRFDVVGIMDWTYARPRLWSFLEACYASVDYQLFLVPVLACFFQNARSTRVYIHAVVYSFLAGCLFYYFFPSSGPAGILQSPHFSPVQRLTSLKFYKVHHFEEVETIRGGMIAFPSFHVAWAVLLTYAAYPRKWLLIPVAALNACLIASTFLLGWHFFVDLPAGILLALLSLWAGEITHRRLGEGSAL